MFGLLARARRLNWIEHRSSTCPGSAGADHLHQSPPSHVQNLESVKKVGGWTGTGKPDLSRLLKLSDAARRLGCHVETLRLWVRDGDLKAVRGPHGAYYVAPEDMHGLLAYRRSRPVVLVTPGGTARAWAAIERGLSSAELALLRAARQDPALNLALYRIVAVHHLMAL